MDSELYNAVIHDNLNVLEIMEARLSVSNQLTPTNSTVLHLASEYRSIECVKQILCNHESLLLQTNLRDETALHLASRHGHSDVVELLINAAKASTDVQSSQEQAVTTSIVLIRSTDVEGETALHLAVRYNQMNVVQLLVKEDPSHEHLKNKRHETPLYLASTRHYADIISTILDSCKSPTFDGPDRRTALHAAVLADGGRECVKLLLSKGNKNLIGVQDIHGWTAFHFVAYNDLYTIVEDLVDAENKCVGYKSLGYQSDRRKRTPLHIAAYAGSVRVMVELVKYYPDSWEIVDRKGRNILHIAVKQKKMRVINYILSQNSIIRNNLLNQRDYKGNTPPHLIAKMAYYVPQLMDYWKADWNVDWEVTNNNNLTPLDVLQYKQETDTLDHASSWVSKVRRTLTAGRVKNHRNLWETQIQQDPERGKRVARHYEELGKENFKFLKELASTHMIVAALIATVALTAGFSVPGGFDGNPGQTEGQPQLLRKAAFKAFMITDALTVFFSVSSLLLYFISAMRMGLSFLQRVIASAGILNVCSIITMMLSFGTGTYAVLAPSSGLAFDICLLSTIVFPLCFFMSFFHYFRKLYIAYRKQSCFR